jgi:hypothetical protein
MLAFSGLDRTALWNYGIQSGAQGIQAGLTAEIHPALCDKGQAERVPDKGLPRYLIVTTGQVALRITYWAVEPNTSFPTLDLLRTPMTISRH